MNFTKAIQAAIIAGNEILNVYESDDFKIETKSDDSPLTLADQLSNKVIMEHLSTTSFPILSEESIEILYEERKNWETFWLVDPLDGTKEFINRNGEFTVNIALIENQKPIFGVIYVPVHKKLYFTWEGNSYMQEKVENISHFNIEEAFRLEKRKPADDIVVVASKSHLNKETESIIAKIALEKAPKKVDILSVGSSLKLCMVAEGKADFYPRYAPTSEWDIAAGHAICKGAGVPVLQAENKQEVIYNKEDILNPWFEVGSWENL